MKRPKALVFAAAIALTVTAAGCRKPAVEAAASDATPSEALATAAPASDASSPDTDSQSSSSTQVADSGPPNQSSGCHTTTVGGGYTPGFNGSPGIYTPGQQMTICDPPPIARPPALEPARAAPVAAAPVAAAAPAPVAAQPASAN